MVSLSSDASSDDGVKHSSLHDRIKIVSQQSTSRPGCIIQLDAIADAAHVCGLPSENIILFSRLFDNVK
jgi:hypothetical protein